MIPRILWLLSKRSLTPINHLSPKLVIASNNQLTPMIISNHSNRIDTLRRFDTRTNSNEYWPSKSNAHIGNQIIDKYEKTSKKIDFNKYILVIYFYNKYIANYIILININIIYTCIYNQIIKLNFKKVFFY